MAKGKDLSADVPKKDLIVAPQMEADELAGMYGDMGKEHVNVPRLIIVENMSPELNEGIASLGEFFLKGPNEKLGKEPIEVVVLMRSHSRMSWKPMAEGGGILCQATDGKKGLGTPGGDCGLCPNKDWAGGNKPLCDLYENFVVVKRSDLKGSAGEAAPFAISGSRARLKQLKNFNTLLMPLVQRRLPLFAKSFNVRIVEQKNATQQVYRIFSFAPANNNQILPAEEQQVAYELYSAFKGRVVVSQEQEGGTSVGEAPAGSPTY